MSDVAAVLAVVALLARVLIAVAADRGLGDAFAAGRAVGAARNVPLAGTAEVRFELAAAVAAVAHCRVVVVTLLGPFEDAIAARDVVATVARPAVGRARTAQLATGADRVAAVAGALCAAVRRIGRALALLAHAVARGRRAALAGLQLARRAAAVAARNVAVVALFETRLDPVAAYD